MVHPCFSAEAHFYRCTGNFSLSSLSLFLSGCLSPSLLLAHSSHSLLGIRPQPQCCDGRWQLAQKGWHVIGKCAAPKMSFLIKRFWSVVNCRMLEKWETACGLKYNDMIWKDNRNIYTVYSSLQYMFYFIQKNPERYICSKPHTEWKDT